MTEPLVAKERKKERKLDAQEIFSFQSKWKKIWVWRLWWCQWLGLCKNTKWWENQKGLHTKSILLFILCRYSIIRYFQRDAPGWYVHLLENRDFKVQIYWWDLSNIITALKFSPCRGCNGGVCYCDDRDACNQGSSFVPSFLPVAMFSLLFAYLQ